MLDDSSKQFKWPGSVKRQQSLTSRSDPLQIFHLTMPLYYIVAHTYTNTEILKFIGIRNPEKL